MHPCHSHECRNCTSLSVCEVTIPPPTAAPCVDICPSQQQRQHQLQAPAQRGRVKGPVILTHILALDPKVFPFPASCPVCSASSTCSRGKKLPWRHPASRWKPARNSTASSRLPWKTSRQVHIAPIHLALALRLALALALGLLVVVVQKREGLVSPALEAQREQLPQRHECLRGGSVASRLVEHPKPSLYNIYPYRARGAWVSV